MTTRLVIGYALLALLVAGCAFAVWWTIHNSERNVRRRKRHARRAQRKPGEVRDGGANDEADKLG
jgi:CHASE3 domain sensor protein